MLKLSFSPSDMHMLSTERFHHPHPRVQLKMEVLWLKSQKLQHQDIRRLCGICENTLLAYFREFQEGGVERLKEVRFRRPQGDVMAHRESLEAYFRDHPPATAAQAQAVIEQRTGLRRSLTQVRQFLQRIGLKPRKVGMIPAKADVTAQEAFKKNPGALAGRSQGWCA